MEKVKKKRSILKNSLIEIGAVLLVIVFVNIISGFLFTRFDLTSERRYTLSDSTKEMMKNIDEQILFRVFLEGDDLPADYRRFRNDIKNMLDQFRAYNRYVEYEFVNPNSFKTDEEKMLRFVRKHIAERAPFYEQAHYIIDAPDQLHPSNDEQIAEKIYRLVTHNL